MFLRPVLASVVNEQDMDAWDMMKYSIKERRDIIGKHWFAQSSPLDDFAMEGGKLTFNDLAVKKGYEQAGGVYVADIYSRDGKRRKKLDSIESGTAELDVRKWLESNEVVELEIKSRRPDAKKANPWVRVTLRGGDVAGVWHQD